MSRRVAGAAVVLLAALASAGADAGVREPVLKQIDLPHSYYWRELYLPQLTTGPSSLAFTPDGGSLVYSMGGSLWRQPIDAAESVELTHSTGAYDYQPDVAPDGRSIVFCRYDGRSVELWRLDLATGQEQRLTSTGAVNVEPRISPDGRKLVWVSTAGTGHFNLEIAMLDASGLHGERFLVPPRRSRIDRYYYSPFDHAVNPSWSPDGRRVFFVGNAEIAWGSGDIWSVGVDDARDLRRVLHEETTWSARPEVSPDGHRLLYSSYRGRQWHQLWLSTPDGAPPLPLTFGDFDRRNARWSPDGRRVAFISNEHGNTEFGLVDLPGGALHVLRPGQRRYRLPQARVTIDVRDERGRPVPARVSVDASDGRSYAPDDAWMHADDNFDRSVQQVETHYFHCLSPCSLQVPAGATRIDVQHGFGFRPWTRTVQLAPETTETVTAQLQPNRLPEGYGRFVSADLHVHMNYGGHYRNTPQHLAEQARAEDLDAVYDLIVNKEERVPDVELFRPDPDPAGGQDVLLMHAQEFHASYWGHLGLLHLQDHLLLPGFASYRHTALGSPYPHNGVIADLAHAQGGLVGYVHPFDYAMDPVKEPSLTHMLPADVAHGKVDYIEITGFSDHKATADVWYRLLNLGFRLPAGAGTDAMANYASLRGPVGLNRVFLDTGGERTPTALREALRAGRSFASNGPLLGLEIGGQRPGGTLAGPGHVSYRIALRSRAPIDHLELVQNGRVLRAFELPGDRRSFDGSGEIDVPAAGWLLLRAWNDGADPSILDLYPYATTSPVYVMGQRPPAPADASYFVTWMDRVIAAASARDDYDTGEERRATIDYLKEARATYADLLKRAGGSGR